MERLPEVWQVETDGANAHGGVGYAMHDNGGCHALGFND
jgi:hypothetical protein